MPFNEVTIVGRACSDPEQKGSGPAKFRLAHGGGKAKSSGKEYPVQFFSVVVWDKTEAAKVKKGAKLEISGRLHDATWTDKDGARHYQTDIVAEEITLEDAKAHPQVPQAAQPIADSDIPF